MLVGPSHGRHRDACRHADCQLLLQGAARSAPDYIRESILNPSAYVVPGPTFGAGGQSVMPPLGALLKPEEVEQLVAYLATFK